MKQAIAINTERNMSLTIVFYSELLHMKDIFLHQFYIKELLKES
jgi:hypothetical protein